jgi:hypothetical protein
MCKLQDTDWRRRGRVQRLSSRLSVKRRGRLELYVPRARLIRRRPTGLRCRFDEPWLKKISWKVRFLEFRILPPLPYL